MILTPAIGDALHAATTTESAFTALHGLIPEMGDDQLIATYQRAEELGKRAWLVQAHCLWEAQRRNGHGDKLDAIYGICRTFEISRSSAYELIQVWEKFGEEISERSEILPLPRSYYVEAAQAPDPQKALALAEDKKAEDPRYSVRDFKAEIQAERREIAAQERAAEPLAVATAGERFGVLLIDPPWRYSTIRPNGSAENHYGTMNSTDMGTLPIGHVAAPDCVLILWATWPKLAEALELVAAWGFEQISGLPWIKIEGERPDRPNFGIGFWVRGCSEPIIIARRGNVSPPADNWVGLISPNFEHSRKPESIYDYAESLPGPYCEIFARRPREGWTSLGNEIDGKDIRDALAEVIG